MTTTAAVPDFAAIKAKQQRTWASGDYSAVAARLPLISELLIDAADLPAGARVLDVAGGSGNAALAAARAGSDVVCTDYVPSLLERARRRAVAEGLAIETREADAESLPFDDASFDAVISAIGVMFALDQERAAAQLLRVCRPGGRIALASWTPDGFIGELFRTVGAHVPPPAGVRPPVLWGSEKRLGELLGHGVDDVRHERRTYTFRHRSPNEFVDFFRDNYGPIHKAFAALDDTGQTALYDDLADLARRSDRLAGDGAVAIPADYLETVAVRSG
jgi:SAM-dependent methyltransferase